ncbi:adenylate/guanylate cyclase domain-containing protein [Geitlerinema calcuttense]
MRQTLTQILIKYHLEKIKTLGDAYRVVGRLPQQASIAIPRLD